MGFTEERKLIGEGKTANVYLWNGFAYKCFGADYPKNMIDFEYSVQSVVCGTRLPVARYYPSEIPHSIKMDYIDGISLVDAIKQGRVPRWLSDMTELAEKIHENSGKGLPGISPFLSQAVNRAKVDENIRLTAARYISEIPEGGALCHFDFHVLNIMLTAEGYRIIDWLSAKCGNPVYDFARSYVIMLEFVRPFARSWYEAVMGCGISPETFNKAVFVTAVHRLTEQESPTVRELINGLAEGRGLPRL